MIKILIVDDHSIVREGMKQILADIDDMRVAGEAANGADALALVQKHVFDVVLLDISMPGRSGLDVLKELKNIQPHLPVLMLSMYPEEQYAIRALRSGALGYLTKESAPDELILAIRKVCKGGRYVSASLAENMASKIDRKSEQSPHELLSDREYQVMCFIASGKAVKDIAEELSLSVKTISTYRSRILAKMQMKTNAELTRYALQNSLVS
jgi:two-component system, NarL family, invasion response regulator UvrY